MCCETLVSHSFRALQLPMDMYLEPEYWAETGEMDVVEQHEMDVVTNKLFTVCPKQGHLEPGKKVVVECSFVHSHQGTSRLPVMLKLHRGREILVKLFVCVLVWAVSV